MDGEGTLRHFEYMPGVAGRWQASCDGGPALAACRFWRRERERRSGFHPTHFILGPHPSPGRGRFFQLAYRGLLAFVEATMVVLEYLGFCGACSALC